MNTSINRRDLLQALKVIRTKGKTNTEKMTALNNINCSDWIGYMGDTDFEIVYPHLCQLADQCMIAGPIIRTFFFKYSQRYVGTIKEEYPIEVQFQRHEVKYYSRAQEWEYVEKPQQSRIK